MAVAKEYKFAEPSRVVANYGKALAHSARVDIIQRLLGEEVVGYEDLVDDIPLARSTVNCHLRVLERMGLLQRGAHPNGSAGYRLDREQLLTYQLTVRELFVGVARVVEIGEGERISDGWVG